MTTDALQLQPVKITTITQRIPDRQTADEIAKHFNQRYEGPFHVTGSDLDGFYVLKVAR